jgi:hypothetical protein
MEIIQKIFPTSVLPPTHPAINRSFIVGWIKFKADSIFLGGFSILFNY